MVRKRRKLKGCRYGTSDVSVMVYSFKTQRNMNQIWKNVNIYFTVIAEM